MDLNMTITLIFKSSFQHILVLYLYVLVARELLVKNHFRESYALTIKNYLVILKWERVYSHLLVTIINR